MCVRVCVYVWSVCQVRTRIKNDRRLGAHLPVGNFAAKQLALIVREHGIDSLSLQSRLRYRRLRWAEALREQFVAGCL